MNSERSDTMATTNMTIRIDEDLKAQFEELVEGLGLTLTTAITAYVKQAVREQQIPFMLSMGTPNAETAKVIDDARKGIGVSRGFNSVAELMEALNADD